MDPQNAPQTDIVPVISPKMILTLTAIRRDLESVFETLRKVEHGTADQHISDYAHHAAGFVMYGLERCADKEKDELLANRVPPRHD